MVRTNDVKSPIKPEPLVISRSISRPARSGVQGVEQRRAYETLVQPRRL